MNRMKIAVEWARTHGARLALTETGMPIDDLRWQEAFRRLVNLCVLQGVEIQTWMGGSHWAARNHATNHAPGWHQNRTLEPRVAGPLKAAAGIAQAVLFDDVVSVATGGAVQIAVYARGHLAQPLSLQIASDAGGSFNKTALVIPAGANGEDRFTFTPAPDSVTTLTYTSDRSGQPLPPARTIYALADPLARAATQPCGSEQREVEAYVGLHHGLGGDLGGLHVGEGPFQRGEPASPALIAPCGVPFICTEVPGVAGSIINGAAALPTTQPVSTAPCGHSAGVPSRRPRKCPPKRTVGLSAPPR
jgi:hypothetical protein